MSRVIQVQSGVTLKLANVLQRKVDVNGLMNLPRQHGEMVAYIKDKGFLPVGPVIHKSVLSYDKSCRAEMSAYLLQRLNGGIENPQMPYFMTGLIQVNNCLYTRFRGRNEDISFAYDKMNLIAYEHEISLSNESYTVIVNEGNGNIVADIFMEQLMRE